MQARKGRPRNQVMFPDGQRIDTTDASKAEEAKGSLERSDEEKLMRSVLENDEETVSRGKLISDALNQGFSSFVPDMMFDNLVKNFSMARNIYGDKLLRLITGYSGSYLKKNINIPEFQRELKESIRKCIDSLKEDDLLTRGGGISDKGLALASLVMYTEELDSLVSRGFDGEKENREISHYGIKKEARDYRKGDRFRDIDIRKTLRLAIRRGRGSIKSDELKVSDRESKGKIALVYGMDASGSMKGKKIEAAKKAGIALSFKAIENKDKVGLIVFGTEIEKKIDPTDDFLKILQEIVGTKASRETNLTQTIRESIAMFPNTATTKHLILITDAVPTIGKDPEKEALEAATIARDSGITISIIGIQLKAKGEELAERIVRAGGGRLYGLKDSSLADTVILEDYRAL